MANVLLVDDDMMFRDVMDKFLEVDGHCVLMAEDAETAMELVAQRPSWPHVILTDMNMPGMSGKAFMKNYHDIKPEIPFIIMSSSFTKNEEGMFGSYQVSKAEPRTIVEYVNKVTSH